MLVGGCGAGGDSADLASLVPPDAPLYVEANLSPDSDQAGAVAAITERVAGISDPRAPVIEALDRSFADAGLDLSYADDVEPWLGDRAAAFVSSFESSRVADGIPDFAALLAVDDADAAREFAHRAGESAPGTRPAAQYAAFEYDYHVAPREPGVAIGIVDDVLVLGTEPAFKVAVDASEGGIAGRHQEKVRSRKRKPARLATLYLEPTAVLQAQLAARDMHGGRCPHAPEAAARRVHAAGRRRAQRDARERQHRLRGDDRHTGRGDQGVAAARRPPGGSWLALAVPRLGPPPEQRTETGHRQRQPGPARRSPSSGDSLVAAAGVSIIAAKSMLTLPGVALSAAATGCVNSASSGFRTWTPPPCMSRAASCACRTAVGSR